MWICLNLVSAGQVILKGQDWCDCSFNAHVGIVEAQGSSAEDQERKPSIRQLEYFTYSDRPELVIRLLKSSDRRTKFSGVSFATHTLIRSRTSPMGLRLDPLWGLLDSLDS